PLALAVLLIPVLLVSALSLAQMTNSILVYVLLGYAGLNVLYSYWLKAMAIMDIAALASYYILRLFAGAMAANTDVSFWLLSFAIFAFSSFGLLKRAAE